MFKLWSGLRKRRKEIKRIKKEKQRNEDKAIGMLFLSWIIRRKMESLGKLIIGKNFMLKWRKRKVN